MQISQKQIKYHNNEQQVFYEQKYKANNYNSHPIILISQQIEQINFDSKGYILGYYKNDMISITNPMEYILTQAYSQTIYSLMIETVLNQQRKIRSGILIPHLYLTIIYFQFKAYIYLFKMKTKKQSFQTSSILAQLILQTRNSTYDKMNKMLAELNDKIQHIHRNHYYTKQLYLGIVQRQQYNIEQKLMKKNRLTNNNKSCLLAVHFKLTEKTSSHVTYLQSWLLSVSKHHINARVEQQDAIQQFAYLLEEIVRALKCQFLNDFANMGQQFKSRYILDYEIETNPNKKSLKKLSPLHYQKMWIKQALLDDQSKITVTCYHNTNKKLLTIIAQQKQWPHHKPIIKHGSQQTKPSNSGQYQLSTSIEQKTTNHQQINIRKTSMFQFYDQQLNITVLSNDSQSFKKSTGRIEGVYTGEELQNQQQQQQQKEENFDYDDDEFQLLIEEDALQQLSNPKHQQDRRIMNIQRQIEQMFYQLDQTAVGGYFI